MSKQDIINELRMAKANLDDLIQKSWELGGYCSGEQEFEAIGAVSDARAQIERLDVMVNKLNDSKEVIK